MSNALSWADRLDELDAAPRLMVQALNQIVMVKRKAFSPLPPGVAYCGMQDFLLRHGVWYKPTPWTGEFTEGIRKRCYGNSLEAAIMDDLKYIEGVVMIRGIPLDIQHGWNTDADGTLIDRTLCNAGIAYLGVEFSPYRADHVTWHQDATILDNPRDGFALYREPWKGEDFSLTWEPSPAIAIYQTARERGGTTRMTLQEQP